MSTPAPNTRVVRFGPFEADLRTGELRKNGLRVKLQDQPFQILVMLIESRGELVTRDDIKERLWPADTFVDFDHSVNTAIRRLRDALCDSADDPHYVATLPRRGYRFMAGVELIGGGDHPANGPAFVQGAEVSDSNRRVTPEVPRLSAITEENPPIRAAEETPASSLPEGRRFPRWIRYGVAGLLFVAAGLIALRYLETSRSVEASSVTAGSHPSGRFDSIAILPLANETGDPALDYMTDGLAESLIDSLSEIPGLRVVSRNSAFHLRNSRLTTSEVGKRLNAGAVLTGSVRKTDQNLLKISVELVDAKTDRHIWGQAYPFRVDQAGPIQPMLARELYDVLRLKLDSAAEERIARQETTDPAAYDAYLRGRFAFRLRNRDSLQQAVTQFQHAIDLDPNFGIAYAGLADAITVSSFYGGVAPRTALAVAEGAARHALLLAPDRPMVRLTWAYQLAHGHHNPAAAIAEASRVVNANPNLADARYALGAFLEMSGRMEEALQQRRVGMALDPEWPTARICYFLNLLTLRRYQDAREIATNPLDKVSIALYEERYKDAVAIFDTVKESAGLDVPCRALAYARGGRRSEAETMLRQLLDQRRNGYASPSAIALVYFALGDRDSSFKWLNTAADEFDLGAAFLPHNPLLDPLHGDPRWTEFTRKMATAR